MEKEILQQLDDMEKEIESINKKLANLADELEHTNYKDKIQKLKQEETECHSRRNQLFFLSKDLWKELYDEEIAKFSNNFNKCVIKKMLRGDYQHNYYLLKLLNTKPSICLDDMLTLAIYKYVTYDSYYISPNIERINKLMKIDDKAFANPAFKSIINQVAFNYVYSVFCSQQIVDNNAFLTYFINYIEKQWKYGAYWLNTEMMVKGLEAHYNYEFVACLGNEQKLEKYLNKPYNAELFDAIIATEDESLKEYIFKYAPETFINSFRIYQKFIEIPEIKAELNDDKSFYTKFLKQSPCSTKYGTIDALFQVREEVFEEFDLQQMVHYFDEIKGQYIYFFQDGEIKKAPILSYIQKCQQKIDFYNEINAFVYSADNIDLIDELEKHYHQYLRMSFDQLCMVALEQSTNENLTPEQIEEWDHLLEIAPTYIARLSKKLHN